MNKYIRESLALLLVLAILSVAVNTKVYAAPKVINETATIENITSGVVLENYNRFTTSGWIRSNVLRVDLSNKDVKVDTLVNKSCISNQTKVRTLATTSGAIAAVNGSFFDMETGYAFGPVMSSGKFDLAATKNNTDLATFSLDDMNNALFSYWDTKVELITPTGERKLVAAYNRYTGYYNYNMYIVDSKWGSKSPGATEKYPDWLEMVVENGIVKEFRENMPGTQIPKNGYVVLATFGHNKFLTDNFKIGDPVDFDITMNVDSSKMKMALTGGTLLVKDGKALTKFTHDPISASTRAPRTAVGTTSDGKSLIVVTVDGRSSKSIGMTQTELAEYMKELGCANAINYDGGGSTTMVTRTPGTTSFSAVNSPSDGYERGVSASLGIFSIAPKGPVDTLLVSSYEDNVFVNTSRAFTARGLDKYLNPVNINTKEIKWSVAGVDGSFKDNTFYPTSVGEAVVTAMLGDTVIGTCPISVLSAPVKLDLNYDKLNTQAGVKTTLSIKGTNKNGYSASIHPSHIKWGVLGNPGTITSNIFTAAKSGTGYVSAKFEGVVAYCPVSIKEVGTKKVIEEFASNAMAIETSSKFATANFSRATNVYRSGPYSGKLNFNFSKNLKDNRAAYINLPNGGYNLDKSTTKLGLWVYSSSKQPVTIGSLVYDKNGNQNYVVFSQSVSWKGWKYLEASLDNINTPSRITKLYVSQSTQKSASGNLYFDNLTMIYTGYPEVISSNSTKSTVPTDINYKERTVSGSDSYCFSVFGQSKVYSDEKNKTEVTMLNSLANKINTTQQASIVVGTIDNLSPKLKVPLLSTTTSYKAIDKDGNRLVQLSTSAGGLRSTDYNQWFWFKNQLSTFKGNNLFVFLAISPDEFKDSQEGALFKETLTAFKKQNTNTNVWVFFKGSSNSSYMERGVKYIATAGFDSEGFSATNKQSAKYVTVKVKGNTITYQFKSV